MDINILLVEDDPFLQDGLGELLLREGYQAAIAGSCKQAQEYIVQNMEAILHSEDAETSNAPERAN